jgi:hypothetical protein
MAGMTEEKQNSAFEVWLIAYGTHLEQVAEGRTPDDASRVLEPTSVSRSAVSDDTSGEGSST